jgi:hypothetical protein
MDLLGHIIMSSGAANYENPPLIWSIVFGDRIFIISIIIVSPYQNIA